MNLLGASCKPSVGVGHQAEDGFLDRPLTRVSALTSASRILGILTDIRGCLTFRPLESRLGQG